MWNLMLESAHKYSARGLLAILLCASTAWAEKPIETPEAHTDEPLASHKSELLAAEGGWTESSGVRTLPSGNLLVGIEAVIPPGGLTIYTLPFDLPADRRIIGFEGYVAFRSGCGAQALGSLMFEGGEYVIIQKLPWKTGGADNQRLEYHETLENSWDHGTIKIEADPAANCPGTTTWELWGFLKLEPAKEPIATGRTRR